MSSSSNNMGGQFGDTTHTKVFVGGLAWETQKDTMKKYFQQFGEILEAVVIMDKNTGRSKGYGFVTFKEAEAAKKACEDPAPVIDGRRANCNLASLGVQRSRPSTPQHGGAGRNFRVMKSFQTGFQGGVGVGGTPFHSPPTLQQYYAIQQGIPCAFYGYSPYSPNYTCPTSYYNGCGGTNSHYLVYGAAATGTVGSSSSSFYPYFQYGVGLDFQYPQHHFQYPIGVPQHYAQPISVNAIPPSPPGASVSTGLASPAVAAMAPHYPSQTNTLRPISSV